MEKIKLDFSRLSNNQRTVVAKRILASMRKRELARVDIPPDETTLYRKRKYDLPKEELTGAARSTFMEVALSQVGKGTKHRALASALTAYGIKTGANRYPSALYGYMIYSILFGSPPLVKPTKLFRTSLNVNMKFGSMDLGDFGLYTAMATSDKLFGSRARFDWNQSVGEKTPGGPDSARADLTSVLLPSGSDPQFRVRMPLATIPIFTIATGGLQDDPTNPRDQTEQRPTAKCSVIPVGLASAAIMWADGNETVAAGFLRNAKQYEGFQSVKTSILGKSPYLGDPVLEYFYRLFGDHSDLVFAYQTPQPSSFSRAAAFELSWGELISYSRQGLVYHEKADTPQELPGGFTVMLELHVSDREIEYMCQTDIDNIRRNPTLLYNQMHAVVRGMGSGDSKVKSGRVIADIYSTRGEPESLGKNNTPTIGRLYLDQDGVPFWHADGDNYQEYMATVSDTLEIRNGVNTTAMSLYRKGPNGRLQRTPKIDDTYSRKVGANMMLFTDYVNKKILYTEPDGRHGVIDLELARPMSFTELGNLLEGDVRAYATLVWFMCTGSARFANVDLSDYMTSGFDPDEDILQGQDFEVFSQFVSSLEGTYGIPDGEMTLRQYITLFPPGKLRTLAAFNMQTAFNALSSSDPDNRLISVPVRMRMVAGLYILKELAAYIDLVKTSPEAAQSSHIGVALAVFSQGYGENAMSNDPSPEVDPDYLPESVPFMRGQERGQNFTMPAHQVRTTRRMKHCPPIAILGVAAGGGKCVSRYAMVPTSEGLLHMGEIYDNHTFGTPVDNQRPVKFDVLTTEGVKAANAAYTTSGLTTVVTLKNGAEIDGLPEHKLYVFREGKYEFVRLDKLLPGDALPKHGRTGLFGSNLDLTAYNDIDYSSVTERTTQNSMSLEHSIPTVMTDALAEVLGWIVSEGSCNNGCYEISQMDDGMRQRIYDKCVNVFGECVHNAPVEKGYSVRIKNKAVELWLAQQVIGRGYSMHRFIPEMVRRAPKHIFATFLRSLFEGDGTVYLMNKGCKDKFKFGGYAVEYDTISKVLAQQLLVSLENFGIAAKITRSKPYKSLGGVTCRYRVTINRDSWSLFRSEIGFLSESKRDLLDIAVDYYEAEKDSNNFKVSGSENKLPVGDFVNSVYDDIEAAIEGLTCTLTYAWGRGVEKRTDTRPISLRMLHIHAFGSAAKNSIGTRYVRGYSKGGITNRWTVERLRDIIVYLKRAVPHAYARLKPETFDKLRIIKDAYAKQWTFVESVKVGTVQQVYDICVPGPHNYATQTIMSHNTSVMIHDTLKMMKRGLVKRALILMPGPIVGQFCSEIVRFTGGGVNVIPITSDTLTSSDSLAYGEFDQYDAKGNFAKAGSVGWGIERLTAALRSMPPNSIVVGGYDAITHSSRREDVGYAGAKTSVTPIINLLTRVGFDYVAIDEAHTIRTEGGAKANDMFKLLRNATYRRLATGTLVANRIEQIATLIAIVDPTIFGTITAFKRQFPSPVRGKKLKKLTELLRTRCNMIQVRRVEWQELLPPVTRITDKVTMGPELTAQYVALFADLQGKLDSLENAALERNSALPASRQDLANKNVKEMFQKIRNGEVSMDAFPELKGDVTRLQTLVNVGDPTIGLVSPKIDTIVENCVTHIKQRAVLQNGTYISDSEKIIVFCNLYSERNAIVAALNSHPDIPAGSVIAYSATQKLACLSSFKSDSSKLILVGIQSSMNTGLNLQHASLLVRSVPVVTPSDEEQGDARIIRPIYRGKDKRQSIVIRTVCMLGTIDEINLAVLRGKINQATAAEVANNEMEWPASNKYPATYTGSVYRDNGDGTSSLVPAAGLPISEEIGPLSFNPKDDLSPSKLGFPLTTLYITPQNIEAWRNWRDVYKFAHSARPYMLDLNGNIAQGVLFDDKGDPAGTADQYLFETYGLPYVLMSQIVQAPPKSSMDRAESALLSRAKASAELLDALGLTDKSSLTLSMYASYLNDATVPLEQRKALEESISGIAVADTLVTEQIFGLVEACREIEYDQYVNETNEKGEYINRLPRNPDGSFKMTEVVQEAPPPGSAIMARICYPAGMELYDRELKDKKGNVIGTELGTLRFDSWWEKKSNALSKTFSAEIEAMMEVDGMIWQLYRDLATATAPDDESLKMVKQGIRTQIADLESSREIARGSAPQSIPAYNMATVSDVSTIETLMSEESKAKDMSGSMVSQYNDVIEELKKIIGSLSQANADAILTDTPLTADGTVYPAVTDLRLHTEVGEAVPYFTSDNGKLLANSVIYDGSSGIYYVKLRIVRTGKVRQFQMNAVFVIQRSNTNSGSIFKRMCEIAGEAGGKPLPVEVWEADAEILGEYGNPHTEVPMDEPPPTVEEIEDTDTQVEIVDRISDEAPKDEEGNPEPPSETEAPLPKPKKVRVKKSDGTVETKPVKPKKPVREKKPLSFALDLEILNGVMALVYNGKEPAVHALLRTMGYADAPDNEVFYVKTPQDAAILYATVPQVIAEIVKAKPVVKMPPNMEAWDKLAKGFKPMKQMDARVFGIPSAAGIANSYKLMGRASPSTVLCFPTTRIAANSIQLGVMIPTALGMHPALLPIVKTLITSRVVAKGVKPSVSKNGGWIVDRNKNDCFRFFLNVLDLWKSLSALSNSVTITNMKDLTQRLASLHTQNVVPTAAQQQTTGADISQP